MTPASWQLASLRAALNQVLIVIMINIPSISFGLAFGWVSLTSGAHYGDGDGDGDGDDGGRGAVLAAVTTFSAAVAGVPLSAWALARGRKFAMVATSACFIVCWGLKLAGGCGSSGGLCGVWGGAARAAAGVGGAAAWAVAPLLAGEMCAARWLGAAVSALPLAHNAGVLLMYLAAASAAPRRALLWWCLGLSVLHCAVSLCMPESPSFLAAQGKLQEAQEALTFLRGAPPTAAQLAALPAPVRRRSAWALVRDMLSDRRRRRAFVIGVVAVVGQEACGVLAILQYAERVFVLVQGAAPPAAVNATAAVSALASPARHAVLLGVVQLVFSGASLYLIERVGRRPLLVWTAAMTGGALAAAAALVGAGAADGGPAGAAGGGPAGAAGVSWAGAALATAVAADAAGLASAPYAVLAEMFHYEYRGCALLLALAGASAGNAIESGVFPVLAGAGLAPALALAAALTLAYAVFAAVAVPETRDRTPEQIYAALCPAHSTEREDCESGINGDIKKTVLKKTEKTAKESYGGYIDKNGRYITPTKHAIYDFDKKNSIGKTVCNRDSDVNVITPGNIRVDTEAHPGRFNTTDLEYAGSVDQIPNGYETIIMKTNQESNCSKNTDISTDSTANMSSEPSKNKISETVFSQKQNNSVSTSPDVLKCRGETVSRKVAGRTNCEQCTSVCTRL